MCDLAAPERKEGLYMNKAFALSLLVLLFLPTALHSEQPVTDWIEYRNDQLGIEVSYPANWKTSESYNKSATDPFFLYFKAPQHEGAREFVVSFGWQPNKNPRQLTVDEWAAAELKTLSSLEDRYSHSSAHSNPAVKMETDGKFGHTVSYFFTINKSDILSASYIRGKDVTLDEVFAAEKIIHTIRFLKPNP